MAERFGADPSADDGVRRVAVCPDCGWWEKADNTIGDEQPCGTEDDFGFCPGVCVVREIRIVPAIGAYEYPAPPTAAKLAGIVGRIDKAVGRDHEDPAAWALVEEAVDDLRTLLAVPAPPAQGEPTQRHIQNSKGAEHGR